MQLSGAVGGCFSSRGLHVIRALKTQVLFSPACFLCAALSYFLLLHEMFSTHSRRCRPPPGEDPSAVKAVAVLMPDLIVGAKGESKLHAWQTISATRLRRVLIEKLHFSFFFFPLGASDLQITSNPLPLPPSLPSQPRHAPTICSSITITSCSPSPLRLPSLLPANLPLTHSSLLRRATGFCPPSPHLSFSPPPASSSLLSKCFVVGGDDN